MSRGWESIHWVAENININFQSVCNYRIRWAADKRQAGSNHQHPPFDKRKERPRKSRAQVLVSFVSMKVNTELFSFVRRYVVEKAN